MRDKKAFHELCVRRDYYTNLMLKKEGVLQMYKFDDAFCQMLYCNRRGQESEAEDLFKKISAKIKEWI